MLSQYEIQTLRTLVSKNLHDKVDKRDKERERERT